MAYEIAQIRITKFCTGLEFGVDEFDTNPFFEDEREWIAPANEVSLDDLVKKIDDDRFKVESDFYCIEIIPIGEGVDTAFSTGVASLQDAGGSSDFEPCFSQLVQETEKLLSQQKAIENRKDSVALKAVLELVYDVEFIGLFYFWYDPGDGWTTDPYAGVDFICRVDPSKLHLLSESSDEQKNLS